MLHALVKPAFSVIGFIIARFGLGFGESGNFPAALKTVAEWFPKKDRAFATGIFNAGANVGAVLAPLTIPLVVSSTGKNWQFAFLMTGIFSARKQTTAEKQTRHQSNRHDARAHGRAPFTSCQGHNNCLHSP